MIQTLEMAFEEVSQKYIETNELVYNTLKFLLRIEIDRQKALHVDTKFVGITNLKSPNLYNFTGGTIAFPTDEVVGTLKSIPSAETLTESCAHENFSLESVVNNKDGTQDMVGWCIDCETDLTVKNVVYKPERSHVDDKTLKMSWGFESKEVKNES